jgi:hypothetical protein
VISFNSSELVKIFGLQSPAPKRAKEIKARFRWLSFELKHFDVLATQCRHSDERFCSQLCTGRISPESVDAAKGALKNLELQDASCGGSSDVPIENLRQRKDNQRNKGTRKAKPAGDIERSAMHPFSGLWYIDAYHCHITPVSLHRSRCENQLNSCKFQSIDNQILLRAMLCLLIAISLFADTGKMDPIEDERPRNPTTNEKQDIKANERKLPEDLRTAERESDSTKATEKGAATKLVPGTKRRSLRNLQENTPGVEVARETEGEDELEPQNGRNDNVKISVKRRAGRNRATNGLQGAAAIEKPLKNVNVENEEVRGPVPGRLKKAGGYFEFDVNEEGAKKDVEKNSGGSDRKKSSDRAAMEENIKEAEFGVGDAKPERRGERGNSPDDEDNVKNQVRQPTIRVMQ